MQYEVTHHPERILPARYHRPPARTASVQKIVVGVILISLTGCISPIPSASVERKTVLPVPPEELTELEQPGPVQPDPVIPPEQPVQMSAQSLISTTFRYHPDIKSFYQRFKVEEARYDFFYVSRDALTPQLSLDNS